MMNNKITQTVLLATLLSAVCLPLAADEFSSGDLKAWKQDYMKVVNKGREAFTDSGLGSNGVVCAQCHPNGANTHPETYPKFQKQLGQVAAMWQMINWCIKNPLEGKELAADDERMIALQAYITHERRGRKLAPGKH